MLYVYITNEKDVMDILDECPFKTLGEKVKLSNI